MLTILIGAIFAILVSLASMPLLRRLAIQYEILDKPNHRTVHESLIPKLGGVGLFLGLAAGSAVLAAGSGWSPKYLALLATGATVLILGIFDDMGGLSCYRKLTVESVLASIMIFFGFEITTLHLPTGSSIELGLFSIPLTLLWIVGLTNAMNLLDGMDGLAAGYTIITGLVVIVISGFTRNPEIAALMLVTVLATLGFLKYNLPSAKIFMGDAGSLFLGFFMACISIDAFTSSSSGTNIAALLVCFSLPVVDTLLAVLRRVSAGRHPFSPDNRHIHHRLLNALRNKVSALFTVYTVTFLTGALAILVLISDRTHATVIMLTSVVVFYVLALYYLGCFDFLTLKKVVGKSEAK